MSAKGMGALFQNSRKTQQNHPDYQGNFNLTKELLDAFCNAFDRANGGECKVQLGGWKKQDKNGKPYLSLSVAPPYEPQQQPTGAPQRPRSAPVHSDDIPF